VVSFSLTPTMSARWLKPGAMDRLHAREGEPRGLLERWYLAALRVCLRHPVVTLALAALVMGSTLPLYRMVPQDYIPSDVDEGEFDININGPHQVRFPGMTATKIAVEGSTRTAAPGGAVLGPSRSAS